jgi:diaminohydroxyphosphoribosylaminopyrimidine deaminase/5-amino-6-(5-phosphoribosylamino)uracil reductase
MQAALGLARRGLGGVWPNPSVGCVVVAGGRVVGRGRTAAGGRPHAETEALRQAGTLARGGTAYVSLEPCSHHGHTPPCAEALIKAGIVRAVVALEDPDPRVSGRGVAALRQAGIEVEIGCGAEAAREVNAGFITRIERGRPMLTLKVASSLDGRVATHRGESRWITGEAARDYGHLLRADHDAIMIGSGTALADDPRLDCRLPGLERRSPLRIVVDGHLVLPLTGRLVASAKERPLWVLTRPGNPPARLAALAGCGVEVIEIPPAADGRIDLAAAMRELGSRGLTRLLVEAGGHLAAALMRAQLVDRLAWFRAPMLLGGDGLAAVLSFGVDRLEDAPRWRRLSVACFGPDIFEILERD